MLKGVKRCFLYIAGVLAIITVIVTGSVSVFADNIVQSFSASSNPSKGTIVSLKGDASNSVEATPGNRPDLIFGVVVDKNLASITLDKAGATTYVASQGEFSVLVTNERGAINKGDLVSISSTAGLGAKADANQSIVLGKAETAFNGQDALIGKAGKYNIGQVTVSINITKNPSFKNTLAIPEPLQKIGNSIAGRETSPLKIYIALVLFLVSSALTLVLLVVGTRGGLTAIGRNPLSKHTVLHALFQVIGAAVVIFIGSLVGVYLLLRI